MDLDFETILGIILIFAFISMMRGKGIGRRQRRMQEEIEHLRAERAIAAPPTSTPPAPSVEQMRKLEERVRVLERIVTDRSQDLAREIEDLREHSSVREH